MIFKDSEQSFTSSSLKVDAALSESGEFFLGSGRERNSRISYLFSEPDVYSPSGVKKRNAPPKLVTERKLQNLDVEKPADDVEANEMLMTIEQDKMEDIIFEDGDDRGMVVEERAKSQQQLRDGLGMERPTFLIIEPEPLYLL